MLFELNDVELWRSGALVLRGVEARIPAGVSAIVGPSGSGKSTILRLLNRLVDPSRGTVSYDGTDVRDLDPLALRREVNLVPQLPALLDGTVADNLRFAAHLGGREADVPALLELAGLDRGLADRDSTRLSVGERQRAMLARGLALHPRVLLLDEPTSALDAAARGAIESTIGDLATRLGVSIVLVTHDAAQARRLATWIVRVEAGRAVAEGPTDKLLSAGQTVEGRGV